MKCTGVVISWNRNRSILFLMQELVGLTTSSSKLAESGPHELLT